MIDKLTEFIKTHIRDFTIVSLLIALYFCVIDPQSPNLLWLLVLAILFFLLAVMISVAAIYIVNYIVPDLPTTIKAVGSLVVSCFFVGMVVGALVAEQILLLLRSAFG